MRYFRSYLGNVTGPPPIVLDHVAAVAAGDRLYVETGWPLYSAIPHFVEVCGGRVKIVHLTRHLVPMALSHMVHQTYSGSPRKDQYTEMATLDPWTENVFQKSERTSWEDMEPYEHCVFWCTEVHAYGFELPGYLADTPLLRVRFEDLFDPSRNALEEVVDFIGLSWDQGLERHLTIRKDAWHHQNLLDFDWRSIEMHPLAMEVLERMGYSLEDVDPSLLEERYVGPPTHS
jgi:hypothetical protein